MLMATLPRSYNQSFPHISSIYYATSDYDRSYDWEVDISGIPARIVLLPGYRQWTSNRLPHWIIFRQSPVLFGSPTNEVPHSTNTLWTSELSQNPRSSNQEGEVIGTPSHVRRPFLIGHLPSLTPCGFCHPARA